MATIIYTLHNSLPNLPPRTIIIEAAAALNPTDEKIIAWLQRQQPYLIEGETWKVISRKSADATPNPEKINF